MFQDRSCRGTIAAMVMKVIRSSDGDGIKLLLLFGGRIRHGSDGEV